GIQVQILIFITGMLVSNAQVEHGILQYAERKSASQVPSKHPLRSAGARWRAEEIDSDALICCLQEIDSQPCLDTGSHPRTVRLPIVHLQTHRCRRAIGIQAYPVHGGPDP